MLMTKEELFKETLKLSREMVGWKVSSVGREAIDDDDPDPEYLFTIYLEKKGLRSMIGYNEGRTKFKAVSIYANELGFWLKIKKKE